ncbi:DUF5655 domain-containing protein [Fulvivirgaceae bacterium BMA10]|uniref:DUF5655 domain-containing protein n=1 Tax=Splendidivirga corallicola TaxID=3051826 RepID=A0ABT8KQ46_9BACT|nr:DUF5655 domain-containing protein [Fulvivirgaceae bacterium BMA10]
MAKSSAQIEQEFMEGLAKNTAHSLEQWMAIIKRTELNNRNKILHWLKTNHSFGHVNASLLAGIYMNGGKPVYKNTDGLLADQFIKKEHLKPLYKELIDRILIEIPETRIEIKKTYTSLNAKREFAAIGIKSKEIRLAIDLPDEPDGINFLKMTGIGCMPRISHMIKLVSQSQIDQGLMENLKMAFNRLN